MKRTSSPRKSGGKTSPTQNGSNSQKQSKNARVSLSPAVAAGMPQKKDNDLAERLELLEARIRQPPAQQAFQDHSNDQASMLSALQSPTMSQHSFTFDTPSLSHSSSNNNNNNNNNTQNKHSNISAMSSTSAAPSQKRPRTCGAATAPSSLEAVSQAAEQHIRKMAALEQDTNSRNGGSNMSQQTLRTSHKADDAANADRVIKETPPASVPPDMPPPKGANPRALVIAKTDDNNNNNNNNNNNRKADKRKSVPVKKEGPGVRPRKSTATATMANENNNTANQSAGDTRKRTRLQFSSDAPKTSPLPNNSSNSGSNPGAKKSSGTNNSKTNKAPKNNKLIHDFFAAARTSGPMEKSSLQHNNNNKSTYLSNKTPSTPTTTKASANSAAASPPPAGTPSPNTQVAHWRQKCQQWEQLCQEKDAQLQAVSNNRTILQTAVQSALKQREAELDSLKKEHQGYNHKVNTVVEDLMRQQALQEAQRLREQLAADGTRLGRIVYTRAGMRSMESWEEGTASRHLKERREKLQSQLAALEKRQERARVSVQAFAQMNENKENTTAEPPVAEGIPLETHLDALEAVESVRWHIENVRRKLYDLEQEEKRLKEEKIEHIQNLKRVASEDSSGFRHRPKLHERYVLMSQLGKGGFSEVWKAYDVKELQEVAVKIHQLDPRWSDEKKESYTRHVSREYEIHRNVRHPRIVSLLDVFEINTNAFATVLECCNGTDLETLLKQEKRLPERDARAILLQLLSGMKYLSHPSADGNRQGIIHYDLKPGNILFDEHGDAKITDFGLSKIVDAHDPAESMELTSQGAGTYWYLPPECFVMEENVTVRISNKVDVWSIGVIYFQMLYGRRPFGHGMSQDRLLTNHTMLNAKEVVFPEQPEVSEMGKQFIRDCLQYDQTWRPTIAQLCDNPYVTTKNFT